MGGSTVHHYINPMYTERKSGIMDYSCCNSGLVSLSLCRALVVCGLKHIFTGLFPVNLAIALCLQAIVAKES